MKDIDFDELDRAVNSLMGSVPKDNPVTSDSDSVSTTTAVDDTAINTSPVLESSSVEIASSEEVRAEPDLLDKPTEEAHGEPKRPEPAVPQRRGRFMDMVHPSRQDADRSSQAAAARRHGVTLQPSVSAGSEAAASLMPSEESEQQKSTPEIEIPEALQMNTIRELEDTASIATAATPPAPEIATEIGTTSTAEMTDEAAPLSSPFLADAKVEKRPLGRPADIEATPTTNSDSTTSEEPASDPSTTVTPEESLSPEKDTQLPEQPLPAELDSKLLSIERDTSTFGQPAPSAAAVPSTEAVSSPSPAPVANAASPLTDTARAMAATSIPQQYKLETAGAHPEAPVGGIYDTQPLTHPASSKPGWIWIVAIVVILVFGALGGAAVYYLGLI